MPAASEHPLGQYRLGVERGRRRCSSAGPSFPRDGSSYHPHAAVAPPIRILPRPAKILGSRQASAAQSLRRTREVKRVCFRTRGWVTSMRARGEGRASWSDGVGTERSYSERVEQSRSESVE
ncbi:hypothetical protein FA09DRAFT_91806 [Tilletiopsis washingtonensis]|uniref:Uncharacterized protein n=1 Tax=Tilletiopsis washingtonensis TaxID=58919 RepID=A0A316Z5C7_9BASI|nr:hypothetical protein FA09DRAFT_91806 [Tilletiopsis washingtonensis]PWN96516.1 hypothetical protein FA09DRAFT_91806 [Tilletiopsis washingtonensis]